MTRNGEQIDGLGLALMTSRFDGVVRAMRNTLLRTARCLALSIGRDFSCVVLTANDEVLSVADSLPIHVFSGPDLMAKAMRELHPEFRRGDAFLNNSPYHGNSHAADWSILVPVFDADDVHRFTVVAKAHLADCGNSIPTSIHTGALDVYNEGALIFPSVKVQENYEDNPDFIRMSQLRIRSPEVWYGDYLAIIGAVRVGERKLIEVLDEFGPDAIDQYTRGWFDYSEARTAAAIRELPSGTATVSTQHDPLPGAPEGLPVQATVTVDSAAARVTVDLRENLDCQPLGLNLTESTSRTAAMVGVLSGLSQSVPLNHGSFRCLDVLVRENCMVGIPRHPASCSAATTHLAEHVAKCTTMALAELGDGFGQAEVGKAMPPATAALFGHDPRGAGGPFANFLLLLLTNGAGTPKADGWLTLMTMGIAGQHGHDSIELDELRYPVKVVEQRIVPDSEGAGRFRGAPSAYVEYGPVDTSFEVIYMSDGTLNAPRGVRGGMSGAPARQYRRTIDRELVELDSFGMVEVSAGETIISVCTGGGGYGPPGERDPALVAHDVAEGWVSVERAREIYRVIVDSEGEVDEVGTASLRATAA